ncbi:carboxymuconolactone decarboxylase family protein [Litorivivens sp.]|uniref:carboxymuconolactone decarboxylase family protein n=1 Tax=Litorivivens sp. TaxID=2020868 RepID=UPI003565F2BB
MSRIDPVDAEVCSADQRTLFETVEEKMGSVPNVLKTLGHSTAALDAYLKLSAAQEKSAFTAAERELLSLAISAENSCKYCVSAHSAIASQLKLSEEQIKAAMSGRAGDVRMEAALRLAKTLAAERGWVGDDALQSARKAGLKDGEVMDIVLAVTANTLTNYANHLADTDIDFPPVDLP